MIKMADMLSMDDEAHARQVELQAESYKLLRSLLRSN